MSENTKKITLNGLFWNALDRFGNQAIVTIVAIITAMIISPDEFPVIAALAIFSIIATTFVDGRLATSLVSTRVVGESGYSSLFIVNLSVSAVIYLILCFASPYIAEYYNIPGLALYARVLFLQII